MFDKTCNIHYNFNVLNDSEKIKLKFSYPDMVRATAKPVIIC
jgi:hypothetical protein